LSTLGPLTGESTTMRVLQRSRTVVALGRLLGSRRTRIATGVGFCVLAIASCVLLGRRLTSTSWPLQHADMVLVASASVAYLASFVLRALGWRRLFPHAERPDRSRCLAACGAAAASGAVLPFRLDYLVKISILRRLGGVKLGLGAIGLSIVSLGLIDAVAMLPLASAAIATSGSVFRAPLVVVILFCIGCLGILAAGPRLIQLPIVRRSDRMKAICGRLADSADVSRSTFAAAAFLMGCWTSRALGSTLLLAALGVGFSPTLALVVLCMAAAASLLPITAGGAAVGIGATAAVLLSLGVSRSEAINFSLASGLLLTSAALVAAAVGISGSLLMTAQRRRAVRIVTA
jgi:uncharacterized membrane protein YbhN (UPF0104 family)